MKSAPPIIAHIEDNKEFADTIERNLRSEESRADWEFHCINVDRKAVREEPASEKEKVLESLGTLFKKAKTEDRDLVVILDLSLSEPPNQGLNLNENLQGLDWLPDIRSRIGFSPLFILSAWGRNLDLEGITWLMTELFTAGADEILWKERSYLTQLPSLIRSYTSPGSDTTMLPTASESFIVQGPSPAMKEVWKFADKVAKSDYPVLITGETGTGKEMVANTIHILSQRKKNVLVAINCAAIPGNLLESELFGNEKGAYTGADKLYVGRFEQADNGTLFLDEIGEMDFGLQAKLLRVLQEGRIQRLHGNEEIPVDFRVIAATNMNLEKKVAEGNFREDLYYRLNVITINVPSLRQRRSDIPHLARFFLEKARRNLERGTLTIDEKGMSKLMNHPWPGNVRELENAMKRGALLSSGHLLNVELALADDSLGGEVPGGREFPEDSAMQSNIEDPPSKRKPAILTADSEIELIAKEIRKRVNDGNPVRLKEIKDLIEVHALSVEKEVEGNEGSRAKSYARALMAQVSEEIDTGTIINGNDKPYYSPTNEIRNTKDALERALKNSFKKHWLA